LKALPHPEEGANVRLGAHAVVVAGPQRESLVGVDAVHAEIEGLIFSVRLVKIERPSVAA
jgi:hypothetical protein